MTQRSEFLTGRQGDGDSKVEDERLEIWHMALFLIDDSNLHADSVGHEYATIERIDLDVFM